MPKKIVLTCALSGASTPKKLNENIPITPEEIAIDAYNAWKAGAAIVHLHMRNDEGVGIMSAERCEKTVKLIRAHKDCDVIINCTSSGSMTPLTSEQRMEQFKKIPDIEIGSYDAGTMNWGCSSVFDNNPQFLEALGRCYIEYNVKPEIEVFDMGMLTSVEHYIKTGSLKAPCYFQFVLGVLGGMPATPENVLYLKNHLPAGSIWSAFGIGPAHLPIMYAALSMGADGIRVGLEDNVYMSKGVPATNPGLVARAVLVINTFGCDVASPAETREILGIPQLKR